MGAAEVHVRKASDLDRFVDQHLTASAVMVQLAEPLPPTMRALAAKRELKSKEYDLALLEDRQLKIVTLKRLNALGREDMARPALEFAESPRRDRLIERTLPVREVVNKLLRDSEPLLVVGEAGVTHIVTVADFAGVAGTAVVLSFLLAVDRALNELLRPRAEEVVMAIGEDQRHDAQALYAKAQRKGTELELIDYLSMGSRFVALEKLGLRRGLNLSSSELRDMLDVRNEAAHRSLADARAALRAVATAERVLSHLQSADLTAAA